MKKLITIYELNSIKKIAPFVDGFIIGNNSFGTRLTNSFSVNDINDAITKIKLLDKEIFINANQMFTDVQLTEFVKTINLIYTKDVSGIIVADLGTYQVLTKNGLGKKVIYNPETLLTNTFDFNYLASFNALGGFVAKEITLEDILSIGQNKKYQMFMVGHGHLNMFYSKRQLLENYGKYNKSDEILHNKQNLTITEAKRSNKNYPILEDTAGTHVFRSTVFATIDNLQALSTVVDYLVLDTIFKDDDYGLSIAKLYKNTDDNVVEIEQLKLKYKEQWDEGFLFKKTSYKR